MFDGTFRWLRSPAEVACEGRAGEGPARRFPSPGLEVECRSVRRIPRHPRLMVRDALATEVAGFLVGNVGALARSVANVAMTSWGEAGLPIAELEKHTRLDAGQAGGSHDFCHQRWIGTVIRSGMRKQSRAKRQNSQGNTNTKDALQRNRHFHLLLTCDLVLWKEVCDSRRPVTLVQAPLLLSVDYP
jgi:hypothetical protein